MQKPGGQTWNDGRFQMGSRAPLVPPLATALDARQTLPRTLKGPCPGRPGNFKTCRRKPRSLNRVGKQMCKKVVPRLIDLERRYWRFIAIFAIPREPLKLRQHVRHISEVFWRHILCCLKGVFVMLGREKNNLAAKQLFYSTTCGERTKHGRKFVLHKKFNHI